MRKIIILFAFLFSIVQLAQAQTSFHDGTGTNPDASSVGDFQSVTKGFLVPRMTLAQKTAIGTPANGLLVYQTDGIAGFWYYNGTAWVLISSSSGNGFIENRAVDNAAAGQAASFDITGNGEIGGGLEIAGQTAMNTYTPAANTALTINTSTTYTKGIDMTLSGGTGTGINISSASSNYNGITVANSGSASATYYGVSGQLTSGVGLAKGYLGYHTGTGNTAANYFAGYFQGKTAVTSDNSPTSVSDFEVQNTVAGAGNPASASLRQTTSNTTNGTVLTNLDFGDNNQTTGQARIQTIRGAASSGASDLPTAMLFSTTPDASATLTERMRIDAAGNVGINTTAPGQKLEVQGNIKLDDNMMVEGNSAYRVYRNLATYNSSSSGAAGAFVINTNQAWNSACMFRLKVEGYFYDATSPFETTIGGYMYTGNDFYNKGYINVGAKNLAVRFARNVSTNTVAIILGDEATSYSYPKLTITSYMQGHSTPNETYADGWTMAQITSLTGYDYVTTVPNVTTLPTGSGNYIQNQFAGAQSSSNFWISGTGRSSAFQLNDANTSLTEAGGDALRIGTSSGYIDIGPQNASWAHIQTDRPSFYFNPKITVDGNVEPYTTNAKDIGSTSLRWRDVYSYYHDVTPGDGYGIRFWESDNYKIHMGNAGEYHYGPVTDYSIKTNMNNQAGRGWTWGVTGATPVAAIEATTGNMQIGGNFAQGPLIARPRATWSASGGSTGAVIIKLPGTTANYGMLHMVVDVYEYGSTGATTYILGGHNWNAQWYNYNCQTIGTSNKKVRLAVIGGQYAIVIGETGSSWSYGHVVLSKITTGGYYSGLMDLGGTYTAYQDNAASFTWITGDLNSSTNPSTSTNYIQNQFASAQTANYWISGTAAVGSTAAAAKLHVSGGGQIIGTNGTSSNTRTLTLLSDGQSQINFGSYPGAWTSALQIQNNDNTDFIWISPLQDGTDARFMTAGSGLDIYTNGSSSSGGTFIAKFNNNGSVGTLNLGTTNDPSNDQGNNWLTWGYRSDNNAYYCLRTNYYNNGYSTHSRLQINWHTGIEIGAHTSYGGTRFFDNSPGVGATEIMSIGKGDANVRVTNHIATVKDIVSNQDYGYGLVGLYASDRYQNVFAMGASYRLAANGTTPGNLYGIAWTHTNVGGQSKAGLGHQALFMDNGVTQTAIGNGIWTRATSWMPFIYDLDNTGYYLDPNGNSQVSSVYANNWFRAQGATGLYFQDYGTGIRGVQADGGSYGSVSTYGTLNGWAGYSLTGRYVLMADNAQSCGLYNDVDNYWYFLINRLATNDGYIFYNSYDGHYNMRIQHTNGHNYASYDGDNNWDYYSDKRLKEHIEKEENILDRLMKLDVVNYDFIEHELTEAEKEKGIVFEKRKDKEIGFIAQDVEPYFPSLVSETADPRYDFKVKALGYSSFGILAVGAIKELKIEKDEDIAGLNKQIAELKEEIEKLKSGSAVSSENTELKSEIAELRKMILELGKKVNTK